MQFLRYLSSFGLLSVQLYVCEEAARAPWSTMFAAGSAVRLLMHKSLPRTIDKLVYVDIDTLFLRPVSELWQQFDRFSEPTLVGMVRETEVKGTGYYALRAFTDDFADGQGLNAGVMLLNIRALQRISASWESEILQLWKQHSRRMFLGDQDVLNAYFQRHTAALLVLPCQWNFRSDSYW